LNYSLPPVIIRFIIHLFGKPFAIFSGLPTHHATNLSWFHNIQAFPFFVLVILFFAGVSVLGFLLVRKPAERWPELPPVPNDVISSMLQIPGWCIELPENDLLFQ
jgi:hypothetical protein